MASSKERQDSICISDGLAGDSVENGVEGKGISLEGAAGQYVTGAKE